MLVSSAVCFVHVKNGGFYSTLTPTTSTQHFLVDTVINGVDAVQARKANSSRGGNNDVFFEIARIVSETVLQNDNDIKLSSTNNANTDLSEIQELMDRIQLQQKSTRQQADLVNYIRWIKLLPVATVLDWSNEFQNAINIQTKQAYSSQDCLSRTDFLSRFLFRIIVLPSGSKLSSPLIEPPGTVVLSKLLFGGITISNRQKNYQNLPSDVVQLNSDVTSNPSWTTIVDEPIIERNYDALDIGSAAVLEILILPNNNNAVTADVGSNMLMRGLHWKPSSLFDFIPAVSQPNTENVTDFQYLDQQKATEIIGNYRNDAFRTNFRSRLGGLQPQIDAIIRRVLDGRIIRPLDDAEYNVGSDSISNIQETKINLKETEEIDATMSQAKELELLGLTPVRGLLLYGPPGCGK